MDLLSLTYFQELAKDLNMTRTAGRLYISQQTLSSRIIRMEEELGTPLFYRKPVFSLTPAGEQVLAFASRTTGQYANLQDCLRELSRGERGVLRFGASTLRMDTCIGPVLKDFSSRYPKVELRLTDSISDRLEPMVLAGELDLAIVSSDRVDPELIAVPLMTDDIYLCVTDELLRRHYGEEAEALKRDAWERGAYVGAFAELPFCMFTSRLGGLIRACFAEEHVSPRVYIESTYTHVAAELCFRGLAAGFCTAVVLNDRRDAIPDGLNIIPLMCGGEKRSLSLSLIRHKHRYQTAYARCFSGLVQSFFAGIENTPVARLAGAG